MLCCVEHVDEILLLQLASWISSRVYFVGGDVLGIFTCDGGGGGGGSVVGG